MNTEELTTVNGRKSFYGKAKMERHIRDSEVFTVLKPYGVEVAVYSHHDNKMKIIRNPKEGGDKTYSNTTRAHINAFLNYFGFDKCSKKQMEQYFA